MSIRQPIVRMQLRQAREKRAEEKKAADKKAKEKVEKKNPYEKDDKDSVKRTTIEATSEEEFIEKLKNLDWSKVSDSHSGDLFNFSVNYMKHGCWIQRKQGGFNYAGKHK